jgi:CrcB protein
MSAPVWLAFLVASAAGAVARYVVDRWVGTPRGTLAVNVAGSFILGLVTGFGLYHGLTGDVRFIAGSGFCGAFTTFSTFSLEVLLLVDRRRAPEAVRYVVASVIGGLGAAAVGLALASA